MGDDDPALLVLRAWYVGEAQSRHREMHELLDRAEGQLDRGAGFDQQQVKELRGQIAVLRGAYDKLLVADFEGAIDAARTARHLLADRPGRNLAFAYVLEVIALASAGRGREAHLFANSVIGDQRFAGGPFNPLIYAMPYLGWLGGDLGEVERYGAQLLTIGERFGMDDTIATARYFLGIAAYERNQLHEANEHLAVVLDLLYTSPTIFSTHAAMALALSERAQGRVADSDETAAAMLKHVIDVHSEFLQPVARGFLAELDLRSGRHSAALQWANTADINIERFRYMFYDPDARPSSRLS